LTSFLQKAKIAAKVKLKGVEYGSGLLRKMQKEKRNEEFESGNA